MHCFWRSTLSNLRRKVLYLPRLLQIPVGKRLRKPHVQHPSYQRRPRNSTVSLDQDHIPEDRRPQGQSRSEDASQGQRRKSWGPIQDARQGWNQPYPGQHNGQHSAGYQNPVGRYQFPGGNGAHELPGETLRAVRQLQLQFEGRPDEPQGQTDHGSREFRQFLGRWCQEGLLENEEPRYEAWLQAQKGSQVKATLTPFKISAINRLIFLIIGTGCATVCGRRYSSRATARSTRRCTTRRVCRTCASARATTATASRSWRTPTTANDSVSNCPIGASPPGVELYGTRRHVYPRPSSTPWHLPRVVGEDEDARVVASRAIHRYAPVVRDTSAVQRTDASERKSRSK